MANRKLTREQQKAIFAKQQYNKNRKNNKNLKTVLKIVGVGTLAALLYKFKKPKYMSRPSTYRDYKRKFTVKTLGVSEDKITHLFYGKGSSIGFTGEIMGTRNLRKIKKQLKKMDKEGYIIPGVVLTKKGINKSYIDVGMFKKYQKATKHVNYPRASLRNIVFHEAFHRNAPSPINKSEILSRIYGGLHQNKKFNFRKSKNMIKQDIEEFAWKNTKEYQKESLKIAGVGLGTLSVGGGLGIVGYKKYKRKSKKVSIVSNNG